MINFVVWNYDTGERVKVCDTENEAATIAEEECNKSDFEVTFCVSKALDGCPLSMLDEDNDLYKEDDVVFDTYDLTE